MSDEKPHDSSDSTAGWGDRFPDFIERPPRTVLDSLENFTGEHSESQLRAWRESIPVLQREARELLASIVPAKDYSAVLEYMLPLEARRIDTLFLVSDSVVVLELKGKQVPGQADLDQVSAYARDLRAYHRECQSRPVHAVLVPMRSSERPQCMDGVWVTGPSWLDELVLSLQPNPGKSAVPLKQFLGADAYRPLPTIVQAARELFASGDVREVWRARSATDPAVNTIAAIAHEAARTKTRHLVLVTGVPGSGKTLVGMRAVHAHYLDDLSVPRADGKPTAPALYLSGNGPLVQVLQYIFRQSGGGGRTFVRHIKDYLNTYVPRSAKVPDEHMLVFDEAQRAFTPDRVLELHRTWPKELVKSEPAHFVDLCERIPEWSVLVGLIGTGQEIHAGEEGGLKQWRHAIENCGEPRRWTVHAPAEVEEVFLGGVLETRWVPSLNLDTELRFHGASELHRFVEDLLEGAKCAEAPAMVAEASPRNTEYDLTGLRLWITRDLQKAKRYLQDRYAEHSEARFGLMASSRDRLLEHHGIDNTWNATHRVKIGPWYTDDGDSPLSCRALTICITEFDAQGLELDMALVGWGSDLIRKAGKWDNSQARRYVKKSVKVEDPFQLRVNAYRVLLTRGRDGTVVYVPDVRELDETWGYLRAKGFRDLKD